MTSAPKPAAPAPSGGLFDDEDEDDDMFDSVTKKDNSAEKKGNLCILIYFIFIMKAITT